VHKIYDANDKAHRYGAPELIHGLWYRYCEKCGIYHALISNVELADKFSVSPVTKNEPLAVLDCFVGSSGSAS